MGGSLEGKPLKSLCDDHAIDGILERFYRTLLDGHFRAEERGINDRMSIRAFNDGMPKTNNTEVTSQTKIAKLKAA